MSKKRLSVKELKHKGDEEFQKGDYGQSIKYYSLGLQLDKKSKSQLYSSRSCAYLIQKEYELSISDADCCLLLDPKNLQAIQSKIQSLESIENVKAGYECCMDGLQIYPNNKSLLDLLKELKKKVDDNKRAIDVGEMFRTSIFDKLGSGGGSGNDGGKKVMGGKYGNKALNKSEGKKKNIDNATFERAQQILYSIFKSLKEYFKYEVKYSSWFKNEVSTNKRKYFLKKMWDGLNSNKELEETRSKFYEQVNDVFRNLIVENPDDYLSFLKALNYIRLSSKITKNQEFLKVMMFNPLYPILETKKRALISNFTKYQNQALKAVPDKFPQGALFLFEQFLFFISYYTTNNLEVFKKEEKVDFNGFYENNTVSTTQLSNTNQSNGSGKNKGKKDSNISVISDTTKRRKVHACQHKCPDLYENIFCDVDEFNSLEILQNIYTGKEPIFIVKEIYRLSQTLECYEILNVKSIYEKFLTFFESKELFNLGLKVLSNIASRLIHGVKINKEMKKQIKESVNLALENDKYRLTTIENEDYCVCVANVVLFNETLGKKFKKLLKDLSILLTDNPKNLTFPIARLIAVLCSCKHLSFESLKLEISSRLLKVLSSIEKIEYPNLKLIEKQQVIRFLISASCWLKKSLKKNKSLQFDSFGKKDISDLLKVKKLSTAKGSTPTKGGLTEKKKFFQPTVTRDIVISDLNDGKDNCYMSSVNGYGEFRVLRNLPKTNSLLSCMLCMYTSDLKELKVLKVNEENLSVLFTCQDEKASKKEDYKNIHYCNISSDLVFKLIRTAYDKTNPEIITKSEKELYETLPSLFKRSTLVVEVHKSLLDIFTEILEKQIDENEKSNERIDFTNFREVYLSPIFKGWAFYYGEFDEVCFQPPEGNEIRLFTSFFQKPNMIGGIIPLQNQEFICKASKIIPFCGRMVRIINCLFTFQTLFLFYQNQKELALEFWLSKKDFNQIVKSKSNSLDDEEGKIRGKELYHIPAIAAFVERSVYFSQKKTMYSILNSQTKLKKLDLETFLQMIFDSFKSVNSVYLLPRKPLVDEFINKLTNLFILSQKEFGMPPRKKLSKAIVKFCSEYNGKYHPYVFKTPLEYGMSEINDYLEKNWKNLKAKEVEKEDDEITIMDDSLIKFIEDNLKSKFKCGNCDEPAIHRCQKCQEVYYCSKECQLKNWNTHKIKCKKSNKGKKKKRKQKKKKN